MSRVTDSVRDSVRYSRSEQEEHESQSVENRNYYAISQVEGHSNREHQQQTYGRTGYEYDQRQGNEQVYIRETPQPKPRQVNQQQNRGMNQQYPYVYSQANETLSNPTAQNQRNKENNSKLMNEVYKTASPGTASDERQYLIEEHTWTPNGKGKVFRVFQRFDFVRKLWWFPLVHDYHHYSTNSVFFLHVLDCCRPAVK